MNDFTTNLTALLVRELNAFARELDLYPDDASVWKTAPGITNSTGNLALHVAGNLQHFIGAVLGGTGYVRNRELEFSRSSGTRAEIKAELDAAIAAVHKVLPDLSADTLAKVYPANPAPGKEIATALFLQHLCSHASLHLGQAGYLRRVVTGDLRSAGPVSLAELMSAS
jgi:uncharacterized damage-inducible protein DinB